MYCSSCGEEVKESMKHCPNCGNSLIRGSDNKDFTYITGNTKQKVLSRKRRSRGYMECLEEFIQGDDILSLARAVEKEFAEQDPEECPDSVLVYIEDEVCLASLKGTKVKRYSSVDKLPDKLKGVIDMLVDKNCICAEIYPEYLKLISAKGEEVLTQYLRKKPTLVKNKDYADSLRMYDEPMPFKPGNTLITGKSLVKIGIGISTVLVVISICTYLLYMKQPVQNMENQAAAARVVQQNNQKEENNAFADNENSKEDETDRKESTSNDAGHDYVFSDSSKRYLKEDELYGLTKEQLSIARNEIFARLGRKFNTEELDSYFRNKEWYMPLYEAEDFDAKGDSMLNGYEKANATLITEYERKMGYR